MITGVTDGKGGHLLSGAPDQGLLNMTLPQVQQISRKKLMTKAEKSLYLSLTAKKC